MSNKYLTDNERATILGLILTNPRASMQEVIELCKAEGVEVSKSAVKNFQRQAKEMVYSTSLGRTEDALHPVVESGLIEAAKRIQELNDIYYRLKASLDDGKLWTEKSRITTSKHGSDIVESEMVLNDGLIREMRGCLNDIAKEVGGRSAHAIIEHRNGDTGTVDIHTMILNVQRAEERRNELPESSLPTELLPEGSEKGTDTILDLDAEEAFVEKQEEAIEETEKDDITGED